MSIAKKPTSIATACGVLLVGLGSSIAADWKSDADWMKGFYIHKDVAGTLVAEPMDLVADDADGHINSDEEGRPTATIFGGRTSDLNIVLTLEMDGYADDSVQGERLRWILKRLADGKLQVLSKGRQFKCWRGATPGTWTKELCS